MKYNWQNIRTSVTDKLHTRKSRSRQKRYDFTVGSFLTLSADDLSPIRSHQ